MLRKQLPSSLVLSHLNYCSLVYLDVSRELQKKLQRLQNSCVRYVSGAKKDEHISSYTNKLEWRFKGEKDIFRGSFNVQSYDSGSSSVSSSLISKVPYHYLHNVLAHNISMGHKRYTWRTSEFAQYTRDTLRRKCSRDKTIFTTEINKRRCFFFKYHVSMTQLVAL